MPAGSLTGRKKLNLSPEERARRAAHIRPHGAKGRAAALASRTIEQRRETIRIAIAKRVDNARRFKEMRIADTVEAVRDSRREIEAKAAKLRERLLRPGTAPEERADPAMAAVVLKDYRAEISELWRRERALARDAEEGVAARRGERPPGDFREEWERDGADREIPAALRPLDPDSAVAG